MFLPLVFFFNTSMKTELGLALTRVVGWFLYRDHFCSTKYSLFYWLLKQCCPHGILAVDSFCSSVSFFKHLLTSLITLSKPFFFFTKITKLNLKHSKCPRSIYTLQTLSQSSVLDDTPNCFLILNILAYHLKLTNNILLFLFFPLFLNMKLFLQLNSVS